MKSKIDTGFIMIKLMNDKTTENILGTIKKISDSNPYNQYVIFNSYSEAINTKNVPILHLNQSKFFFGNMIVFDLISLELIKNFPNIKNKTLFAIDIPWLSNTAVPYNKWADLLNDPNLSIIAANRYVADAYELFWKKPITISENFSYEQVQDFI